MSSKYNVYTQPSVFRLLLSRVHIFPSALTGESSAKRILKVLDVLEVLGNTSFVPSGMQYILCLSHSWIG